jgi:hypothetical protein
MCLVALAATKRYLPTTVSLLLSGIKSEDAGSRTEDSLDSQEAPGSDVDNVYSIRALDTFTA